MFRIGRLYLRGNNKNCMLTCMHTQTYTHIYIYIYIFIGKSREEGIKYEKKKENDLL